MFKIINSKLWRDNKPCLCPHSGRKYECGNTCPKFSITNYKSEDYFELLLVCGASEITIKQTKTINNNV